MHCKHEKWYLGESRLDVVNEYQYLGSVLSPKLSTYVTLSHLACRTKACVGRVLKSLRKLVHVTPDVFFKILHEQILPTLLYGSEIWGVDDCQIAERAHILALKSFFNVSSETQN